MGGEGGDRIDFGGDLARMFEQGVAEFGQMQAARGAQDQALTDALLEQRDASRHRGFGQAELGGGAGEAAAVGDAGEDEQVVGFESFHFRDNVIR